jgi:hypothetical protein
MRIVRVAAMAVVLAGVVALPVTDAAARQPKAAAKAADAASQAGTDAEAVLDRARRALDDGKADVAQQLAGTILLSEKKDARGTARALAIRGESYLRQGRAAEATADLESALWIKDGLSGRERELATLARSKAMQQSGLAANAPVLTTPLPAPLPPPAPVRPEPPAARIAMASPPPAPPSPPPASWSNTVKAVPSAPPAPVVSAPPRPQVAAQVERLQERQIQDRPVWNAPAAPTVQPAVPREQVASAPSAPPSSSGGGIGGFFSNLFGGGASSPPADDATLTSGSLPSATERPRAPETSSFAPQRVGPEPRVARAMLPPAQAAPSPPPAPAPPPARAQAVAMTMAPAPAAPSEASVVGGYRLQLAAVRSRQEAEAMAQQVRSEEAALVGQRAFEIVEEEYGRMGRFYRVRIGPYAAPTDALGACASLRDRRMDCMVLDR